jgi:hypothetical protein
VTACGRTSLESTIRTELRIGVQPPRTERAHRTSLDETRQARHIGTYALVPLDAQNAGSGARENEDLRVVLCASLSRRSGTVAVLVSAKSTRLLELDGED